MYPIGKYNKAEKAKLLKGIFSNPLEVAIPQLIALYEDDRDRGIQGTALKELTSDLISLYYEKWEMD